MLLLHATLQKGTERTPKKRTKELLALKVHQAMQQAMGTMGTTDASGVDQVDVQPAQTPGRVIVSTPTVLIDKAV